MVIISKLHTTILSCILRLACFGYSNSLQFVVNCNQMSRLT